MPIKNFFKHPNSPRIDWIELKAGSQKGDAIVHGMHYGETCIEVTSSEDKDDAKARQALNRDGEHTWQIVPLTLLEEEELDRLVRRLQNKIAKTYPPQTVLVLSSPSLDLCRFTDTELVTKITGGIDTQSIMRFHAVWLLQVNVARLVLLAGDPLL